MGLSMPIPTYCACRKGLVSKQTRPAPALINDFIPMYFFGFDFLFAVQKWLPAVDPGERFDSRKNWLSIPYHRFEIRYPAPADSASLKGIQVTGFRIFSLIAYIDCFKWIP